MLPLLQSLKNLDWLNVPNEACRLAKEAIGPYSVIQDLMPSLPDVNVKVFYNPDSQTAFFNYPKDSDSDKVASWHIAIRQVPGVETIQHGYESDPPIDEPFIRVKQALEASNIFGPLASAAQFKENSLNRLWGGPNPLAATIGGGLLGAGLGYGGGALLENILPEEYFEKGKLRKSLGILGGAAGSLRGLHWGYDRMRMNPENPWSLSNWIKSEKEVEGAGPEIEAPQPLTVNRFSGAGEGLKMAIAQEFQELNEQWIKYADEAGGAAFNGQIPVDQFGRVVWNDLSGFGGFTSAPIAAATTGLVNAAALSRGGAEFITPMDIARIGIGMGSGYLAGNFVGRTLGALAGLRPEAQKSLQQAGIWAGILANAVPIVFRGAQ